MSINILAQFLPENRASAKINDNMPKTNIATPNPPNVATPSPASNITTEPKICNIPNIVTPVGLETFEGAASCGGFQVGGAPAVGEGTGGGPTTEETGFPQFGQTSPAMYSFPQLGQNGIGQNHFRGCI